MRHAPAGAVLLLLLAVPALAESGKDIRVVKTATAEVRPYPSTKAMYYVTNRLNKGDAVEVVQELPEGWLKIRPPAGSTSWINTRFLKALTRNQSTHVVALEGTEVPVYPSPADPLDGSRKRPDIEGVRLKRGHQVFGLSKTNSDEQGTWQEIESPDKEARYIRAESVERAGPDVVRASAAGGAGLNRSTAPSANSVPAAEEMRRQAVQADLSGNAAEAVRLYDRISKQFAADYPGLARLSRDRAAYLRGKLADRADPAGRPEAAPVSLGSRPGEGSTFTGRERENPAAGYRGRLSHASKKENRSERLYFLTLSESAGGMSYLYVVAGPGVDLDALVGRSVELRGTLLGYSPDLRAYPLRAIQAAPLD